MCVVWCGVVWCMLDIHVHVHVRVVCGGGPEAEAMDKNDIHVLMG